MMRRLHPILIACAAALAPQGAGAAEPLPQTLQELAKKRARIAPGGDALGPRSWAPAPKKAQKPVSEPVVPPPPPPSLPYGYGGSAVINGKAIVFLEQKHRSLMVARGDIVDGAYRVEAVEQSRALLRYLPLDVVQVLAFGAGGETPLPRVAPVPWQPGAPLFVNVPDRIPLGEERAVPLGIAPGSAAAKATIELTYDADVLNVRGAKIVQPGKALVELSAHAPTPSQVRFRAMVDEGAQTEVGVNVTAFDGQGKRLEVRGIPAFHVIHLVDERS